ncbi:MAG: Chemotaxis protein CheY [Labilithrix sp.]|nr:Chemotaxis protein CheY [Labilithrix sp.]
MNAPDSGNAARSAILRAELFRTGATEVTCALEMTGRSIFVVTDELPPIGETVPMRLSFPNAVEPIDVLGRVVQVRLSSGPGAPSGFVAAFIEENEEGRRALEQLAERLTGPRSWHGPSREISVLLVEDNRLIRDMFAYAVQRYFEQRNGTVRLGQAVDVDAAWSMLAAEPYDLVIVDYFLPTDHGASLIAKLRQDARFAKTAVVAISVGGHDVRQQTLKAGADLFLHKPIVLKELFYTIEFLMNDSGGRDAAPA